MPRREPSLRQAMPGEHAACWALASDLQADWAMAHGSTGMHPEHPSGFFDACRCTLRFEAGGKPTGCIWLPPGEIFS